MAEAAIDLASRRRDREFLNAVVSDINVMLAQFIRAQLILAGLTAVVYTVVLLVMRMPFAVALGIVGGILEFIPVVGPLVAALGICGGLHERKEVTSAAFQINNHCTHDGRAAWINHSASNG